MSLIWKIGLFEKDDNKGICLDCQKQKRAKYVFECKSGSTKMLFDKMFVFYFLFFVAHYFFVSEF